MEGRNMATVDTYVLMSLTLLTFTWLGGVLR